VIIKKMKASFGKLRNAELLLEDGLNIINLPNEAGKSTWSAFIRAMLYGINTSERDRAGYLADKTKYRPWGEYPMEGAMDIIWRGREITLTRKSKGSGLMGYSEAYYTGTSEPCPELSGKSPGDILIGVPEQVFRRSAFISRPSMALDKDTELEKRISALVTSGDEDTSYTEASERLGKWLRKRNRKPSGLLIGIEAKIQKLEERLERLEKENEKLSGLRREKEMLIKEQQALQLCLQKHNQKEQQTLMERYQRKRQEQEELEAEMNSVAAVLSPFGKPITKEDIDLVKNAFDELSNAETLADKAKLRMEETSGELMRAKREAADAGARKPKYIAYLAFTGVILIMLRWFSTISYLWMVGVAFIVLAFVFLALELKRTSKTSAELNADISILESKSKVAQERYTTAYNVVRQAKRRAHAYLKRIAPQAEPENVREVIRELEEGVLRLEQLMLRCRAAGEIADELEKLCPKEVLELPIGEPAMPKQQAESKLVEVESRLEDVSEKLSILTGEVRHLGDPLVLSSEIENLRQESRRLMLECRALELASGALHDANLELQNRFSPVVSQKAGEFMYRLTGGRYTSVLFNKDMKFKVRAENEAVQRDAGYLSDGTLDQLYLAARLAVSELVLQNDEPCPIILDDALANFDDERAKYALELLSEIALYRQIIFFTCRERENI